MLCKGGAMRIETLLGTARHHTYPNLKPGITGKQLILHLCIFSEELPPYEHSAFLTETWNYRI
jgi:hypothetical protein